MEKIQEIEDLLDNFKIESYVHKMYKLSYFTLIPKKKIPLTEKYEIVTINLNNIPSYLVVAAPTIENVKSADVHYRWGIIPLSPNFELVFTFKIIEAGNHEWAFAKAYPCKVDNYHWKMITHWFVREQRWVVPTIVSAIVAFITTLFTNKWW